MPGRNLGQHGVGHRADQVVADLGAVGFRQVALDLAHRQAARIQRDDAVVERGEPAGMFGQQQGLEAAVTVARRRDAHLAVAGQHRLGGHAVAMVGRCLRLLRACRVAQVVRQLGVQGRLDQCLFERDPRRVDRRSGHWAGQELSDQLLGDRGQLRDGAVQLFGSAWHNTPPWRWLCPAHRITDRLGLSTCS